MNNLIVRRPFNVLSDLEQVMDAVFGDFAVTNGHKASRVPTVDVVENDTTYSLHADIPGFAEKDVEIKVDDQLLTINGRIEETKETNEKDKKAGYLIRERRTASFSRSFTLPRDVEKEGIKATVANGVLTIELPKSPKAQPRTIDIKSA